MNLSISRYNCFQNKLDELVTNFNKTHFPSSDYKVKVIKGEINEHEYGLNKVKELEIAYNYLITLFNINIDQTINTTFIDKWYLNPVKQEINFTASLIEQIKDENIKNILMIILSKTFVRVGLLLILIWLHLKNQFIQYIIVISIADVPSSFQ